MFYTIGEAAEKVGVAPRHSGITIKRSFFLLSNDRAAG